MPTDKVIGRVITAPTLHHHAVASGIDVVMQIFRRLDSPFHHSQQFACKARIFSSFDKLYRREESIGADVDVAKKSALSIIHKRAMDLNKPAESPEKEEPKQTKRHRSAMLGMLAQCETLEDYINLGGAA